MHFKKHGFFTHAPPRLRNTVRSMDGSGVRRVSRIGRFRRTGWEADRSIGRDTKHVDTSSSNHNTSKIHISGLFRKQRRASARCRYRRGAYALSAFGLLQSTKLSRCFQFCVRRRPGGRPRATSFAVKNTTRPLSSGIVLYIYIYIYIYTHRHRCTCCQARCVGQGRGGASRWPELWETMESSWKVSLSFTHRGSADLTSLYQGARVAPAVVRAEIIQQSFA